MRLIRRVRVSVIALVPPVDGIHATLSNTGISRAVVGPDVFHTVIIKRDPETIALTSPINATGLIELDQQPADMYLPFEGLGLDMNWEFRMVKAANALDYGSLTDVLLTVDFNAFDSADYRQQVIRQLSPMIQSDRLFSSRVEFADAWYDLHNPELQQPAKRMVVSFQTRTEDFPPNLSELRIENILLYFVRTDGMSSEIGVSLKFTPAGSAAPLGGSVATIDGALSTRRGNAGAWQTILGKNPNGTWEMNLQTGKPDQDEIVKGWFKNEMIEDLMLVVSYSGRVPDWPQ